MTKQQKAKVLELIAQDCEIRCVYINDKGQTCAIGHLAKAAGCPLDDLIVARAFDVSSLGPGDCGLVEISEQRNAVVRMQVAIQNKFGLLYMHQREIQCLNDGGKTREERIESITKYVKELKTED